MLIFACTFYQCNLTKSDVDAFETIVYGEISGFDKSDFPNIGVAFTVKRNGCNSVMIYEGSAQVKETGKYRTVYYSDFDNSKKSDCYQATLIDVSEDTKDSVLVGPKRFDPSFHNNPPYDSVRVDFTYPDSLK